MYLGSGLGPSSWEPWGGNYSVFPTVWTNAHVGQFADPGWVYIGGKGSGLLPGGGSYTAMAPPAHRECTSSSSSGGGSGSGGGGSMDIHHDQRRSVGDACHDVAGAASTSDLTIVLEKLEGAALRFKVPPTVAETVSFQLSAAAYNGVTSMTMWLSNSSHLFVRMADVPVWAGGALSVHLPRDTMITLSTTTGQSKGVAPSSLTAQYAPFPFPHANNFDSDEVHKPAKYLADNEGSFEILPSLDGKKGNDLAQTTPLYPMRGYGDVDPITSFGGADWSNYGISVKAQIVAPRPAFAQGDEFVVDPDSVSGLLRRPAPTFPPPGWTGGLPKPTPQSKPCANCSVADGAYAGVCVRLLVRYSGMCLLVGAGLAPHSPGSAGYHRGWAVVQANTSKCRSWSWSTLAEGSLGANFDLKSWHNLSLAVVGSALSASVDGAPVWSGGSLPGNAARSTSGVPGTIDAAAGLASIRSGYHFARFDELVVFEAASVAPSRWPNVLFDKHLLSPPHAYPGGSSASAVARAAGPLSPPGPKGALKYVVSHSTSLCWDTASKDRVDTRTCVEDGHNELFVHDTVTGHIVASGPQHGPGQEGKCFEGAHAGNSVAALPPSSTLAKCDKGVAEQAFEHGADGALRLKSDRTKCLTSGPQALNAGVLLKPCVVPAKLKAERQTWSFSSASPTPTPTPPAPAHGCTSGSNCGVGCAFTLAKARTVVALGRFSSAWHASDTHLLTLLGGPHGNTTHGSVELDLATAARDVNGYSWAKLQKPVTLAAGARAVVLSGESAASKDRFFDEDTAVQSSALMGFAVPVWRQGGVSHEMGAPDSDSGFSSGHCYGPVNAEFVPEQTEEDAAPLETDDEDAGTPMTISNGLISATVSSACALTSITTAAGTTQITHDDWAVEVDTIRFVGSEQHVGFGIKRESKSSVRCSYDTPPMPGESFAVRFEVPAGYAFVRKQLNVTCTHGGCEGSPANTTKLQLGTVTPALNLSAPAFAQQQFYTDAGGVFARAGVPSSAGLMVVVGNKHTGANGALNACGGLSLSYVFGGGKYKLAEVSPPFVADDVIFAPYAQTQTDVPWPASKLQQAEYEVFWQSLDAYILRRDPKRFPETVKVHVPWTANFLEEVDTARPENLLQAHRVIARCAELGVKHILWSARDSRVADHEASTDSWQWGASLWLTNGENMAKGSWLPSSPGAKLPPSLVTLLAFAKSKDVKLNPYVYPSLAFLNQPGSKDWLFAGGKYGLSRAGSCGKSRGDCHSRLASEAYQDFFAAEMLAFANLTGCGGFGSDYAFINSPTDSPYAQWHGMRRIQKTIMVQHPEFQVDNRQQNHAWGPWFWAPTGSYAEPIQSDEQPESWHAFTPDLHTARLTANRMREMNFDYRFNKLCPSLRAPGFYSHQSDMLNISGQRAWNTNRFFRDFDILGHRYALLSSVGSAGLNSVINTLPARDAAEHDAFPPAEVDFIRKWLSWTDAHKALLESQRPLPIAPGHGKVDGSYMFYGRLGQLCPAAEKASGCAGFVFLFNPNGKAQAPQNITLGHSLGINCTSMPGHSAKIAEVYPQNRTLAMVSCGSAWQPPPMAGKSALVLRIGFGKAADAPLVLGTEGSASFDAATGHLRLTGLRAERGTTRALRVTGLGATTAVKTVSANSLLLPPSTVERAGAADLTTSLRFGAEADAFAQSQELVGTWDAAGSFSSDALLVPAWVFAQLKALNASYPVKWLPNDLSASWLSPGRLLLFLEASAVAAPEPGLPRVNSDCALSVNASVTTTVDGAAIPVLKSYNCRGLQRPDCFSGFYYDLTALKPDVKHKFELKIGGGLGPKVPSLRLFFDNVSPETTTDVFLGF